MTYRASIILEQNGKNGNIRTTVNFEPEGQDPDSEAHTCLAHIAALWLQTEPRMLFDERDNGAEEVYYATLSLSQKAPDGDVYTHLEMVPRIKFDDPTIPSSYEAACFLSNAWLQMCGIIDEEGNVVKEDAVAELDLSVTQSNRVH